MQRKWQFAVLQIEALLAMINLQAIGFARETGKSCRCRKERDIMQQEVRFATFNVRNLAQPGMRFYENVPPYNKELYEAKTDWIARMIDQIDADVIAFQEIFSQAALKYALSKTRRFRDAHHAGFDPDPHRRIKMTPNVALASLLPFAGEPVSHLDLPSGLEATLPTNARLVNQFSRPVLEVPLRLPNGQVIQVLTVHLKSKMPDLVIGADKGNLHDFGVGALRALIRRGTDALGLRLLVTDLRRERGLPMIVMGDFNDIITASSTQIVTGEGYTGLNADFYKLHDCAEIQRLGNALRDVSFTDVYNHNFFTIDHILVTQEFSAAAGFSAGEVLEVLYFNDHVALDQHHTTDHGIVMARIAQRAE